jgi:hypothetical protein
MLKDYCAKINFFLGIPHPEDGGTTWSEEAQLATKQF